MQQFSLFGDIPQPLELPTSERVWSEYQLGLFGWAEDRGNRNALVEAVAGSGKTTSLIETARRVSAGRNSIFVAFNKHIADELGKKLRSVGTPASTLHSLGYALLREAYGAAMEIDAGKYRKILRSWIEEIQRSGERASCWDGNPPPANLVRTVCPKPHPSFERVARMTATRLTRTGRDLFNAMRVTLSGDLAALARRFRIDTTAEEILFFSHLLPHLAKVGADIKRWGCIDYDDMIYLSATLDVIAPSPKDWVFVDEAQDLNVAQRTLVAKLCGPQTRVIFVGDERQAIYGFSGADVASFRNIRATFQAKDLALSICYRCPTSHIELAQQINPAILPADGAKQGILSEVSASMMSDMAADGDLVLCRNNAPLMGACLRMVAKGRKAFVRGREVGKQIAKLAEDIKARFKSKVTFLEALDAWVEVSIREISSLDEEVRADLSERIHDEKDCLRALWVSELHKPHGPNDVEALCKLALQIFADKGASKGGGVCFSTIHKAKGLEAPNVYLLPPQPPHPKARGWELDQEYNLIYVSYTRATDALYFVDQDIPCWKPRQDISTQKPVVAEEDDAY